MVIAGNALVAVVVAAAGRYKIDAVFGRSGTTAVWTDDANYAAHPHAKISTWHSVVLANRRHGKVALDGKACVGDVHWAMVDPNGSNGGSKASGDGADHQGAIMPCWQCVVLAKGRHGIVSWNVAARRVQWTVPGGVVQLGARACQCQKQGRWCAGSDLSEAKKRSAACAEKI